MSDGRKMLIPDDMVMAAWNLGGSNFTTLADTTINSIESGGTLYYAGQTQGQAGVLFPGKRRQKANRRLRHLQ